MGNTYHIHNEYYDNILKEGEKRLYKLENNQNNQNERINDMNERINDFDEQLNRERKIREENNNELKNEIEDLKNMNEKNKRDIQEQEKELKKNKKIIEEHEESLQNQNQKINNLQNDQNRMKNQFINKNRENEKKFNEYNDKIKALQNEGLEKNKKIEQLENELIGQKDMIIDLENKQFENNIELRDLIDAKEKEQKRELNKLEKRFEEAEKKNDDLAFKLNEYIAKNEKEKLELKQQQIQKNQEYIEQLKSLKNQIKEMKNNQKMDKDKINSLQEKLKQIEDMNNKKDDLFDDLNDNDIEYNEITKTMNQIDFKNDEMNNQLKNILINEGVQQKIEIFCQKNIIENSNTFKGIPLLKTNKNIMLLSKSGNGKNTLTNYLCDLDDFKKQKTSGLESCTMENSFYEGKNKDLKFNIIDTRGFEEENYSQKTLMENTIKFINENDTNINKRVDFLFYLIQNNELPDEEKDELIKLKNKFPYIPIVVVNTYSDKSDGDNYNDIKKKVEELGFKFCFVNSLEFFDIENDKKKIEAFGKEKLFEIINSELNNSENLVNIRELYKSMKKKIESNLKVMKLEINTITQNILRDYFELDYKETVVKISNEIIVILKQYVFEEENAFSEKIKSKINNFILEFFDKSYKLFHEKLKELINKNAESLTNKALIEQNEKLVKREKVEIMEKEDLLNKYKRQLEIKLAPNFEREAIKKCLNSLSDILFKNLLNSFENSLNTEINKTKFI